ncbi:MAG: polysaccharide biosynthesis/export family protein [Alistipes sp.]|nr:polysaccharide biosynthesis/export family protein [Alistipes sp.]
MKVLKVLSLALFAALLAGCSAVQRTVYMQDVEHNTALEVAASQQIRIKPYDRLTVVVSSKDPELAAPFNSASSYNSLSGNPVGNASYGSQSLQVRTVDSAGMLYMPIIGNIYCEGKTRSELAADIANKIVEGGYLNDASVNIQFADMKIFVMGEVTRPGQFDITRDQITLLEALAMAGDLTIYGNRSNVTVVRKDSGKTTTYVVNLLDKQLFTSPAYYLQQDDVIYVQPNKYRAATSEINQNRTFWISIVSTLLTAVSLAMTIWVATK